MQCEEHEDSKWGKMLAFDIETLGLIKEESLITVVSFYNPHGIQEVLRFVELDKKKVVYKKDLKVQVAKLVKWMNEAEFLCAFNGTNFDIPFIQIQFGIPNDVVQGWVLKVSSPPTNPKPLKPCTLNPTLKPDLGRSGDLPPRFQAHLQPQHAA